MSAAETVIRVCLYAGLIVFVGRIIIKIVHDCSKDVTRK